MDLLSFQIVAEDVQAINKRMSLFQYLSLHHFCHSTISPYLLHTKVVGIYPKITS